MVSYDHLRPFRFYLFVSDDDEEKSINALVRSFTQLSPTWLKDTAARFQRPLRILADSLDFAQDLLMWR